MKRLLLPLAIIALGLLLVPAVYAAYDDVQFTGDAILSFTDGVGSTNLTITSSSNVGSLTVNTTSLSVGLENGSSITMFSNDRRALMASPAIATMTCGSSSSTLSLSTTTSQTVTVNIGDVCIRNFSVTASSQTDVALAWSGGSTSYTVTNVTTGGTASVSTQTHSMAVT